MPARIVSTSPASCAAICHRKKAVRSNAAAAWLNSLSTIRRRTIYAVPETRHEQPRRGSATSSNHRASVTEAKCLHSSNNTRQGAKMRTKASQFRAAQPKPKLPLLENCPDHTQNLCTSVQQARTQGGKRRHGERRVGKRQDRPSVSL